MTIYSEKTLEKAISNFKKRSDIPKENIEAVLRFMDFLQTSGIGINRRLKYLRSLTTLSLMLDKPFEDGERPDFEKLLAATAKKYKRNTCRGFAIELRRFISWLHGLGPKDHHPSVSWIVAGKKEDRQIESDDLVDDAKLERLVEISPNPRDKAIWRVLNATGLRASELLGLRIKDFHIQEGVYCVAVNGTKTANAKRIVPIIDGKTIQAVRQWIAVHPFKDAENAPLWVDNRGKALEYAALMRGLEKRATKLGLKKLTPHVFRHSWGTRNSDNNGLTHTQLCRAGGWSLNAGIPKTYLHSDEKELIKAFARMRPNGEENALTEKLLHQMLLKAMQNDAFAQMFWSEAKNTPQFKQLALLGKNVTKCETILSVAGENRKKIRKKRH